MPQPAEPLQFGSHPLETGESARAIALGERLVSYVLRRAKRKTIALSIDHRGLRVGAPLRSSLHDVEALILRHGDWVVQKLDEWHQRQGPGLLQIIDGLQLPILGENTEIRLAVGGNRGVWNANGGLTLCLRSPSEAGRVLEKILRDKARVLFLDRLAHYAVQLGITHPPLTLSSARTRWGSCSSRSGIRLNWRLIHFPAHVIDYVVAHELAHLREMNHSPRFWAVVGQLYPDFRKVRGELKRLGAHCPRW